MKNNLNWELPLRRPRFHVSFATVHRNGNRLYRLYRISTPKGQVSVAIEKGLLFHVVKGVRIPYEHTPYNILNAITRWDQERKLYG